MRLARFISKHRVFIIILACLLLIPSVFGMIATKVNYDVLLYLPQDLETVRAQDYIHEDFSSSSFAMITAKGMEPKQVLELKKQIENISGVQTVLSAESLTNAEIPDSMLPDSVKNMLINKDSRLLMVMLKDTSSANSSLEAVKQIRSTINKQCALGGITAVLEDTKELVNKETPIYVGIAVLLALIVLCITMDSFLTPFIFLTCIGFAILYNMGTNIMFGEISYITKAISAVLQLGVSMDYSIFLLHRYQDECKIEPDKNEAMAHAIVNTFTSVMGSSVTTIAGFIALIVMRLTLGRDIGLVMAKGVLLGVISAVTILPAMVLVFDKAIQKCSHKPFIPEFNRTANFITKNYKVFVILFAILLIPSIYGNSNVKVYYNLDRSLPNYLPSIQANQSLKSNFNMMTTHMVLVDNKMDSNTTKHMIKEIEKVDGVESVIGLDKFVGDAIPTDVIPQELRSAFQSDRYKMLVIGSGYGAADPGEVNQVNQLNTIVKKYDEKGLLAGEGPLTKDLINITDDDFKRVSIMSIGIVLLIILFLFQSISLPFILVGVIEFAIFVNMSISFLMGSTLPFIASIVIGTIQLGSTIDYAILMTSSYREHRTLGLDRMESAKKAVASSGKSIMVSALSFFAATFGVGLYSDMEIISALCTLLSRGAIISMLVVILILPSMLVLFDKLIVKTSRGFLPVKSVARIDA